MAKGLGSGGAERLLVASAAARSTDIDIECAYVLPWKDHLAAALERSGVRARCLSSRRRDPFWPLNLARLVRSGQFDVIHVHSPLPGSVARLAARTMKDTERTGIVATEHNTWATHRPPTRMLNRWTSRWNDAAFAVTEEARASMTGRGAGGVETLRHGIDIAAVREKLADRERIRAELDLAPETVAIGTVANFRPQKDYPNLLAAAAILHDRSAPMHVVAVGQGPLEAEMRQRAMELGLDDVVTFIGFRDDATSVMAACDIFVLASQWEGLPVAIMEATALGLPLVLTDVGGISEEFTDGLDALLVPPRQPDALADAIEELVRSAERRERLATASAQRAADFDSSRAVLAVEDAYRRVSRAPLGIAKPDEPARKRRRPALEIRPAAPSDRPALMALMRRSLGADDDVRYSQFFSWKHDENAFGASPMWVACDGDRLAAARAFMRWEFVRGGSIVRAVRAVDTATDPDYQGKGLFTALTLHGLDALRDEGIDFVFNTPNEKSRPGYLKMGWREIGTVPTVVRFSGVAGLKTAVASRVGAERWSEPLDVGEPVSEWIADGRAGAWLSSIDDGQADVRQLRTRTDERYLDWRFGSSLLQYRVVEDGSAAIIVRARRRGAALELAVVATFGDARHADRLSSTAARAVGASHTLRLGRAEARTGFVPLPGGGPILTWRAVCDQGEPPRSNWMLELGDIELF